MAWLIGIRPQKKLRMCVIILRHEAGYPVADPSLVLEEVKAAIDIFDAEANVRLMPVSVFHPTSPFGKKETADDSFNHIDDSPSGAEVLDVSCGVAGWGEDFVGAGSVPIA